MAERGVGRLPPFVASSLLLLATAAATLLAPLADRSIVARAALPGVSGGAPPWAEGPFACDAVVRRRCGGGAAGFRLCDARAEAAVMAQSPLGAAGAIADEDGFARSFRFYACASGDGAPPRARGDDAGAPGARFGYAPPPPPPQLPPAPDGRSRRGRSVDAGEAQFGRPQARFAAAAAAAGGPDAGARELALEEDDLLGAVEARRFSRSQRVGNGQPDAERFGAAHARRIAADEADDARSGGSRGARAADRFGLSVEARMRLGGSGDGESYSMVSDSDARFGIDAGGAAGGGRQPTCDSDARGPVTCLETAGIARIGTSGVRCSCWVRGDVDLGEDSALLRQFPLLEENPTAPRAFEGVPSASISASATLSTTPSPSVSRSSSAWPSLTMSATGSNSPSVSTTSTVSVTASVTATPTPTDSTTPSVTQTPSSSRTASPTPSPTSTLTVSPSRSPTRTPSFSKDTLPSSSPTPSPTSTITPSRTITASPSKTPTPPSPSPSRTVTRTRSNTRTPASIRTTFQPLANTEPVGTYSNDQGTGLSPSHTPSRTQTGSPTTTPTPSGTKSFSKTPTASQVMRPPQSTVVRSS